MGQITYKAFSKKFQNPGAVITALTSSELEGRMVTTLLLSSINKAVEMNISARIALSLAFVGNHISERIVISKI